MQEHRFNGEIPCGFSWCLYFCSYTLLTEDKDIYRFIGNELKIKGSERKFI